MTSRIEDAAVFSRGKFDAADRKCTLELTLNLMVFEKLVARKRQPTVLIQGGFGDLTLFETGSSSAIGTDRGSIGGLPPVSLTKSIAMPLSMSP